MKTNDANKSEVAKREAAVLKFWQERKIFEESVERPAGGEPKGDFVFYDGPPFATGLPHYGHLLAGTIKDVIPRYQTMRGKRVRRRWGWDCHGLPIENLVEQELGLKHKKDIEALGIAEFNQVARRAVLRYASEWERVVPRLGRWVTMSESYRTMDPEYTESVWWAFKNLHERGLIYEGHKSMHLCPRCETTLSNFEVTQGYKNVTDLAVTAKFQLINFATDSVFLLVWTTTPWTLPGNAALAVNPDTNYVRIKTKDTNENYLLAKARVDEVMKGREFEVVEEFVGEKLVGKKYRTLFDYYQTEGEIFPADFVTTEEGTGVVHIAPAFGEDDLNLGQKFNLPFIQHVNPDGTFKPAVKDFAGRQVKPKGQPQETDRLVVEKLAGEGKIFKAEEFTHPYPHCWRCETPLLNYAAQSWFLKVTELKPRLLALNQKINWVPAHLRDGRFGQWLAGARDWAISRSRFWGAPLPVWRCGQCGKVEVIGSLEELRAKLPVNRYLVMRHGEAETNVRQIVSHSLTPKYHLTERGREEVRRAAAALRAEKVDLIIHSDVPRAKETAELLARELGLAAFQTQVDPRLREMDFGPLEGRSVDEYHAQTDLAESQAAINRRALGALNELAVDQKNKTVLFVSHQSPLFGLTGELLATGEWRALPFAALPHNENYELDLHRPYIDEIKWRCECEGRFVRVPEVFDCWFESGSMPFASVGARGRPEQFPAEFIAEGLDQTRGWFYTMLVLSAGLFDAAPYRNVVANGLILAEDGEKMSKSKKNFPDPEAVVERFGADALRLYLLASPAVRGEEFNFSEVGLAEWSRRFLGRLRNVLAFFETYRAPGNLTSEPAEDVLDRWLAARLNQTGRAVTAALDAYLLDGAVRALDELVDDLSVWYLRRSRERFKFSGAAPLGAGLRRLAILLAPFAPFLAQGTWQVVRAESAAASVHLASWPHFARASRGEFELGEIDESILNAMTETRRLVTLGLEAREQAGIKIRQPLAALKIRNSRLIRNNADLIKILREEINVGEIVWDEKLAAEVELDTVLTPELREQGELRELIRELQNWRKTKGLKPGASAAIPVPAERAALAKKIAPEIKRATTASELVF